MPQRGKHWHRTLVLLVLAFALIAAFARPAFAQKAVQNGDWNKSATWGGAVPEYDGTVLIPAGITVTIPAGLLVRNFQNGDGEIKILGKLSISGRLEVQRLIVEAGGALDNNVGGYLSPMFLFVSHGLVTNRGTILNQTAFGYDYGQMVNEAGATFENRGTFSTDSSQTFINRGTLINNAGFDFYSPTENYGTVTNSSGRTMGIWRDFNNHAGAKLSNEGALKVHGCCTLRNDGAVANAGSYFQNDARFFNSCTGRFTGTAMTGNQPALDCPGGVPEVAPTPSPAAAVVTAPAPVTWQYIGAQTSYTSVSVGSASRITATSTKWGDGNYYLLHWYTDKSSFGYENPMVPMMQASIGADGTWWGVKDNGLIYRKSGTSWLQVLGSLKQVSVGSANNIWGVNSANDVFRWSGLGWTRIGSGILRYVSVAADGTVWGITPTSAIVRWNGSSFVTMPGAAVQVSVGSASNVWVVNAAGTVYKWNGTTWDTITDAGLCKAVATAADGTVVVIRASDNSIYRKP